METLNKDNILEFDARIIEAINNEYSAKIWDEKYIEFLVGTENEADEAWDEALEQYIDDALEIPKEIQFYFDREKWKDDARIDGRGHVLNHYDGGELEAEVDGTTYYIFRTG